MIRFTRFAAALLTASLVPASATAQLTPTPTMQPGSPCSAVVTYQWDVTSIDHLTGVRWELKDAPFTNPDGGDPSRIASEKVNEPVGSVEIDLRDYGPVLDGSAYYFRVIGRGGGEGAPPSEVVVFDPTVSLQGQVSASGDPGPPATIEIVFDMVLTGCADRVRWELFRPDGSLFTSDDVPGPFDPDPSSATTVTTQVPDFDADSYELRLAAYHGGTSPADAVGEPGATDVAISGHEPEPEPEPVAVTVIVEDIRAAACTTGAPAVDATVTATRGSEVRQAVSGNYGYTSLSLPPGTWQIAASRPDCGSSASVTWDGSDPSPVILGLPGCEHQFDLAVYLTIPTEVSAPVEVPVNVFNFGAGPAPAGSIEVRRGRPIDPRRTRSPSPFLDPDDFGRSLQTVSFPALCPGGSHEWSVSDPSAEAGTWVYAAAFEGDGGTESGNDRDTAEVRVTGPPDAPPDEPQPPAPPLDLALAAEQSHETLPGGGTMTYTVSVTNATPLDPDPDLPGGVLQDIVVEIGLSPDLVFQNAIGTDEFICLPVGIGPIGFQRIRCEEGDLLRQETATITVTASLPVTASGGSNLRFFARADPFNAFIEVGEENNFDELSATTATVETATYAVTDVMTLVEYAEPHGYHVLIEVEAVAGAAPTPLEACKASYITDFNGDRWMSLIADGGVLGIGLECRFRILVPKPLAAGWSFQSIDVVQSQNPGIVGQCLEESLEEDGSGIEIRVTKPAARPSDINLRQPRLRSSCRLKEIELVGPARSSWQDAFE